MSNYLLSIIIPVYNVEKYLEECITSIHNLDKNIVEIVLVNDGSTDESGLLCDEYAKKNPNIKYIEQKNQGLSEARNTGIKNSSGKYLLFLDSDDYLFCDNLPKLIDAITKNNNQDFFIGRAYEFEDGTVDYKLCQIDYDRVKVDIPEKVFMHLDNIEEFWFAAWLIIINRKFLLEQNLFFKKGIFHEDELWVPSVFVKSKNFCFLNFGFYCYRLNRSGSIISTHNIKREFDKIVIIDEFDKIVVDSSSKRKLLRKRQASLLFGIILKLHYFSKCDEYEELVKQVDSRIKKLIEGKYILVFAMYKLFGGDRLSKLLSK